HLEDCAMRALVSTRSGCNQLIYLGKTCGNLRVKAYFCVLLLVDLFYPYAQHGPPSGQQHLHQLLRMPPIRCFIDAEIVSDTMLDWSASQPVLASMAILLVRRSHDIRPLKWRTKRNGEQPRQSFAQQHIADGPQQ
ncbi:hypothetical protein XpopCFBP1817_19735, partial [Xanthomonas populi]